MLAIIYAGLSILPIGLLIFGTLFLKRKFPKLNIPVILSVGTISIIAEFMVFNSKYAEAIDYKLWNSVSTVVSLFPLFSSITVLALCVVAYCVGDWIQFKNKNVAVMVAFVLGLGLFGLRTGLDPAPSIDFKVISQLAQENCPEDELRKYADLENIDYHLAIVANKNVPADVILKLSFSKNEMVRFYSAFSSKLSTERLLEMKTADESKEVRQQAQNELKLNRNIK
jgi:hypothetical protein